MKKNTNRGSTPGRPLWRRAAGRVRNGLYRVATGVDRVARWRSDAIVPPAHLRIYYYRSVKLDAFSRACTGARNELTDRGLRPEHRVLDIGSGIGNLALGLVGYLEGGYAGVEIHPEAVAWCQRAITPRHPLFRFHRADVANRAYNPRGRVPAAEYRFPFADRSFDFVFLGSVFTHMLPGDVEQYAREIGRLLAPGGLCVAGLFLLNDESRAGVDAGRSFMSFAASHPSGLCRLHNAIKPEAAVAFEETFVRRVYERAGLRIEDVRRGRWWNGQMDGQDLVTARVEC